MFRIPNSVLVKIYCMMMPFFLGTLYLSSHEQTYTHVCVVVVDRAVPFDHSIHCNTHAYTHMYVYHKLMNWVNILVVYRRN